jgi:hypothetical protein
MYDPITAASSIIFRDKDDTATELNISVTEINLTCGDSSAH